MMYLVLLASSIIFVELFIAFKILKDAQAVMSLSLESVNTMKSSNMSDREKEAFMRKNSVIMLVTTLKFIAKFFAIFGIIYSLILIVFNLYPHLSEPIIDSFTSLVPMLILTLVTMVYVWGRNVIYSKL